MLKSLIAVTLVLWMSCAIFLYYRAAEDKLGAAIFKRAYDFLKEARYKDDGATSTVDEGYIRTQLSKITKNVSDCFYIDQLLFLEVQANIDEKFG